MNRACKISFILLILITTIGCIGILDGCGDSTLNIEGYYQIRKYESLPNIDGKNVFFCKLGFPNDPIINHVNYVEWDKKTIKLKTQENKYYIIKARKDKLCCGCGDLVIGPLDKNEYYKNIKSLGIINKLKNTKTLEK